MIALNEYLGGKVNKRKKLIPRNKEELEFIIEQRLKESPDLDLNDIDVSGVEDMRELFTHPNISSIDISGWDIDVIDDYMFYKCEKLKSVILPDSVKSIGYGTFIHCSSLTDINIPDSVVSIGSDAFKFCIRLIKINIPDSVKSIGKNAFAYCKKLTDITIPDSVKNIRESAFFECNSLTDIGIPNSVKSIGWNAFYEVPHITYHGPATWESGNEYWGAKSMN